jgi:hypothetical protein
MANFAISSAAVAPQPPISQALAPIINYVPHVSSILKSVPDLVHEQALLRAAIDFMRRSKWFRDQINMSTAVITPSPTVNVGIYTLTETNAQFEIIDLNGAAIQQPNSISASQPQGAWTPIGYTAPEYIDQNRAPSMPSNVFYVPEGQIGFYPIPDKVYAVQVGVVLELTTTATQLPVALMTKWKRFIESGALAYLYGAKEEDWFDPRERDWHAQIFEDGVANARADVARSNQRGSVRARGRAFAI